ncbi:hypothetical protein KJ567_07120 [Candidatus Bipolaricaulota bacterium]|nr:hypothetical protein [Candidatus Bipolaricaulota bacterium]
MKRMVCLFLIVACIGAVGSCLVVADSVARGFGFGGAMATAYFPDMTGINAFMSENGLPPMSGYLLGAGGSGRGGVIGGPVLGGIGWGVLAASETEDRHAELIFGAGGLDLGAAIGGDESSVLTIGAVLGGGANVLSITGYLVQTVSPEGLVPEPTDREIGRAIGFVQPYVSMSAQLLPWMGFEFRLGYLLPVFGFDFGDLLGIPAPSLDLSGPTISFGLVFGGIGSEDGSERVRTRGKTMVTVESEGTFVVPVRGELAIENMLGDIVVSGYAFDETQSGSERLVEWRAVRTAEEEKIDELLVQANETEAGAALVTTGFGQVDYSVRVPAGTDLKIRNGTGAIQIVSHEAWTIIVENGVGEVGLEDIQAIALIVAAGVGTVNLDGIDAQQLIVDVGAGEIVLALAPDTSARVTAKARLGDVAIDRFPGMTGGVRGFLGKSGDVTLGLGEQAIEVGVGIGRIDIEMRMP